jgi:hypothetical protein
MFQISVHSAGGSGRPGSEIGGGEAALEESPPAGYVTDETDYYRKTQEPLQSSAIVGAVAIVARLIFSVPLCLLTCLGRYRTDLPGSVGQPFPATHFSGYCFRLTNSCVRQLRGFCFPGSALTPSGSLP